MGAALLDSGGRSVSINLLPQDRVAIANAPSCQGRQARCLRRLLLRTVVPPVCLPACLADSLTVLLTHSLTAWLTDTLTDDSLLLLCPPATCPGRSLPRQPSRACVAATFLATFLATSVGMHESDAQAVTTRLLRALVGGCREN